jgi:hypothetical protein
VIGCAMRARMTRALDALRVAWFGDVRHPA